MSAGMTFLLAFTAAVSVANLYISQPLIGLIGPAIHLRPDAYGLVVTLTQFGYAIGLLLLVPLGDFVENRRLMTITLLCGSVTLLLTSLAHNATLYMFACFMIGITSVTTQMVVPMAAHLAAPKRMGRQVSTVVSGLLTGILLSRPVASIIASFTGWRSVFVVSAIMMATTAAIFWRYVPERRPHGRLGYVALLSSLGPLLARTPVLQRRAAYHMSLFFAFTVFWTSIPLELTDAYGLSQRGIAVFSLVGAGGALVAPIAGRFADGGWSRIGTVICISAVLGGTLLAWPGALQPGLLGLAILGLCAILIDGGVQGHTAFAQRALFSLAPEHRSRLNALYIAGAFLAASLGSAVAPFAYARDGWPMVTLVGIVPPLLALSFYLSHTRAEMRRVTP
jgi:predicted MFS family arabinose efflux permease